MSTGTDLQCGYDCRVKPQHYHGASSCHIITSFPGYDTTVYNTGQEIGPEMMVSTQGCNKPFGNQWTQTATDGNHNYNNNYNYNYNYNNNNNYNNNRNRG